MHPLTDPVDPCSPPRGRAQRLASRSFSRRGIAAAAGTAVAVAGLASCSSAPNPRQAPAAQSAATSAADWKTTSGHVHGLGVNPAEDEGVYAATHRGLWRIPAQGSAAADSAPTLIADRWQDTMGFTISGPDVFLASGHPDPREDAPAHLGLLRSTDRGRSWQPVSLNGQADFHDLEAASDGRAYGYDSTQGQVRVSRDAGSTWSSAATAPLRDLAVSPARPDVVLATSARGLLRSTDAARTFSPVTASPPLLLVDWTGDGQAQGTIVGVTPDGTVWTATATANPADPAGPAGSWTTRGRLTGPPQALTAVTANRLLAADSSGVLESNDGGDTWAARP